MYLRNCVYFLGVCLAFGAMASPDVAQFFPQINGNLTAITWAHAVNNQSLLSSTLDDNSTMMIEADVVLGRLINGTNGTITNETLPVMGHPSSNTSNPDSDLSLEQFLTTINSFNVNATNTTIRRGVKLDFKSIEVFNASLTLLGQFNQGNYPLWLNADILPGPVNATTTPVDAQQFLSSASTFNNTVLSIGWTTALAENQTGSYSTDQINSMINVTAQNNVTQNITFPVRAALAAESLSEMTRLVTNVTNSTLTLWSSSETDIVNVTNLRNLIAEIGVGRVFIDLPETLRSQLRLDNLTSNPDTSTPVPGVTTVAPVAPTTPSGANSVMPKLVIGLVLVLLAFICK